MLIDALLTLIGILLAGRAEKPLAAAGADPIVELASTPRSSRTPNALRSRCPRPVLEGG